MLEYKGYEVTQTDHSIYMYRNGRFVLHASVDGMMEEEELHQTLDFLITKCINFKKNSK